MLKSKPASAGKAPKPPPKQITLVSWFDPSKPREEAAAQQRKGPGRPPKVPRVSSSQAEEEGAACMIEEDTGGAGSSPGVTAADTPAQAGEAVTDADARAETETEGDGRNHGEGAEAAAENLNEGDDDEMEWWELEWEGEVQPEGMLAEQGGSEGSWREKQRYRYCPAWRDRFPGIKPYEADDNKVCCEPCNRVMLANDTTVSRHCSGVRHASKHAVWAKRQSKEQLDPDPDVVVAERVVGPMDAYASKAQAGALGPILLQMRSSGQGPIL